LELQVLIKLDRCFPRFDNNPNSYMTLPIRRCEGEGSFSKLSVMKHKSRSTVL